jgi:hypothetical protein
MRRCRTWQQAIRQHQRVIAVIARYEHMLQSRDRAFQRAVGISSDAEAGKDWR